MSVPLAKALPPAPTITTALISGMSGIERMVCASRSYIANVSAFLACGRLIVTRSHWSKRSTFRSFSGSLPAMLVSMAISRRRSTRARARRG